MNPTPCPTCNKFHQDILFSWIDRDFKTLRDLYLKRDAHQAECLIIHSNWYQQLWKNAVIGKDVYQAEYAVETM